jgi:hypothetical protein
MAIYKVHREKAKLSWKLATKLYEEKRDEFLCMNQIFYTVGHLVEAALAQKNKHPGAAPRGVPHADRGAQLRKFLVGGKILEPIAADTYDELSILRNTFADDGIQDQKFIQHYMELAKPLIDALEKSLKK